MPQKYGGAPNAFYQFAFTPRETAMGRTGIASCEGQFAPYWNPAGLAHDNKPNNTIGAGLISRYTPESWYSGLPYCGISYHPYFFIGSICCQPKDWKFAFGLNTVGLLVVDLIETSLSPSDEIIMGGNFETYEILVMPTVAYRSGDFAAGLNYKMIYRDYTKVDNYLTSGYFFAGLDFGFLTELSGKVVPKVFEQTNFGGVIKLDRDHRNQQVKIGVGVSAMTPMRNFCRAKLNCDLTGGNYTSLFSDFGIGVEGIIKPTELLNLLPSKTLTNLELFLRGGITLKGFGTVGIGLFICNIMRLDFSWEQNLWGHNDYFGLTNSPLKGSLCGQYSW